MKTRTPPGSRLHVKNVAPTAASRVAIFIASRRPDGGEIPRKSPQMPILKHIVYYFYLLEAERLLASVSYHLKDNNDYYYFASKANDPRRTCLLLALINLFKLNN